MLADLCGGIVMRKFVLALVLGFSAWYGCVCAATAMAGWLQWVTL